MAVYDLEEQEKIDALRAWWKRWGNTVIAAVSVFVLTYAGIQGWRYYQAKQAVQAALQFAALEKLAQLQESRKIVASAQAIRDDYPRTAYAPRAALIAAKASFAAGDLGNARAQLQWVIDHAKEKPLQELARLRLAAVLAEDKQYDPALRVLADNKDQSFAALTLDLKGDILLAQGKAAQARAAYKSALEKAQPSSDTQGLQTKLDALGEAK